ncbi:Chromosome segregation ATPases [hydrothermal vent metagenome]|uniref:Chromosome segregation ATPases n=1 Tax=hydrothermal vent metagenome TaxID=652676 RepID=A0A3B0TIW2_9ZZZZ
MLLENMMYFVLGFIACALLALMIMPAIWRRATRLTKKRIEAATPLTMSEFRADKDQLRAEFALSTRRLEMNVENLRKRLADQLIEINRKRSDQLQLKSERDEQLTIIGELEQRESDLRRRILDLEKESTDLAQRLRMSERDYSAKASELERLRARNGGVSSAEIDELLNALEKERLRSERLEEQVERLLGQLEIQGTETASAHLAMAEMREDLAGRSDKYDQSQSELIEAEARIANAESRLSELLQETTSIVEFEESKSGQLLAEKLSMEEEMNNLREKVLDTENTILNEWDSERIEQSHLRERLNDIASEVSRLVYSVEEELKEPASQSLFDRVQKFANDETLIVETGLADEDAPPRTGEGRLSARMRALRDVHAR